MKPTFPGLKELLLSLRPNRGSADVAKIRARALFQAPESAMTKGGSLTDFLGQVSLAIPTITIVRVLIASNARHLKAYGLI